MGRTRQTTRTSSEDSGCGAGNDFPEVGDGLGFDEVGDSTPTGRTKTSGWPEEGAAAEAGKGC